MNKLVEIRSQEFMCRERALLDSERRIFWLAQAEEWEQRALDEIAFHFRECNLDSADSQTAHQSADARNLVVLLDHRSQRPQRRWLFDEFFERGVSTATALHRRCSQSAGECASATVPAWSRSA
jgi:hypothetical protein